MESWTHLGFTSMMAACAIRLSFGVGEFRAMWDRLSQTVRIKVKGGMRFDLWCTVEEIRGKCDQV
jgi:hypothetical protein